MMWIFWAGMLVFAPFFSLMLREGATRKASRAWGRGFATACIGVMLSVMHSFGWYVILPIPLRSRSGGSWNSRGIHRGGCWPRVWFTTIESPLSEAQFVVRKRAQARR